MPIPPSSKNEDIEVAEPKEGSDDDKEQMIKSVVGINGLRELVMLPKWTVNSFTSTIKEAHFKTLRANYQIPDYIPIFYLISQKNATMKGWMM